jgi:isopentenyldiphosphate isomerase
MAEEQFNVLDCAGEPTGAWISRGAAHSEGVWHGAFHCLIFYQREGKTFALFQKRSSGKKIAPGRFDVSVGGHYAVGEDAGTAGPREIREELGLIVSPAEFIPLGRRIFVHCFTPGIKEMEFQDVFLLPLSAPPQGLVLQPDEVEAVMEMEVEEGIDLFAGRNASLALPMLLRDGTSVRTTVRAGDFVPCIDRYYLKMLILVRRYMAGERDSLAI